jgi:hypothetical protein
MRRTATATRSTCSRLASHGVRGPATLGLILARQARADLVAGKGYLAGSRQIRLGQTLAWIGIALAAAALVAASVIGVLSLVGATDQHFPKTSN